MRVSSGIKMTKKDSSFFGIFRQQRNMEDTSRLKELKEELYLLTKAAHEGKMNQNEAAEKILQLREEIDALNDHFKKLKAKGT